MVQIKKQIEDLEAQRNLQMRYNYMTNEIAQLQAESATGKIHHLNATKEEKSKILQEMSNEIKSAEESLGVIRQEIKSVEDEKAEFLAKMNEYQREKSQSDKQLADAMRSYEETRAILAVTKKRISQIGERTNELQVQSQTMTNLKVDAESNAKISHAFRHLQIKKQIEDLEAQNLQMRYNYMTNEIAQLQAEQLLYWENPPPQRHNKKKNPKLLRCPMR